MADEGYFLCWKCGDMREEYGISRKLPDQTMPEHGYCPLCGRRDMGYRYEDVRKKAVADG